MLFCCTQADLRGMPSPEEEDLVKLPEFARRNNLKYATAHRLFHKGEIVGIQLGTRTILVKGFKAELNNVKPDHEKGAIIYARVSSMQRQHQLNGQVVRLEELARQKGYKIKDVIEEVGSGYSNERSLLREILRRKDWDVLLVEHREIPIKFGFDYLQAALLASDRSIECRTLLPGTPDAVLASSITNFRELLGRVFAVQGLHKKAILEKLDRVED